MLRVISKISPADMLTMANAVCAIIAITFFIRTMGGGFTQGDVNYITIGCCLLLVSMTLDGFDGKVARKFGSKHSYGPHLDSVADMVSFSIAPGILIFCSFYTTDMDNSTQFLLIMALVSSVVFGMWRLVVFIKEGHEHSDFIGLPTPSNCVFIFLMCYFYVNYRIGNMDDLYVIKDVVWVLTSPPQGLIIMALTSLLMMSTFLFVKARGWAMVIMGFVMFGTFVGFIGSIQGQPLYFIPQMVGLGFAGIYIVLCIIFDVSNTSKSGWLKRSKQLKDRKKQRRSERRKIKDEMKKLRAEKAELQRETRALRRMKARLLGGRATKRDADNGDDDQQQVDYENEDKDNNNNDSDDKEDLQS